MLSLAHLLPLLHPCAIYIDLLVQEPKRSKVPSHMPAFKANLFPLLRPCAIRFPESKAQASMLSVAHLLPLLSPCLKTPQTPSHMLSMAHCFPWRAPLPFRFSVSKSPKVLSHMRSVAHLLFAFRSAHVPLKFSGPKPIFESKTREHRVFSNMFFQPFLFKSFSCKQERPI